MRPRTHSRNRFFLFATIVAATATAAALTACGSSGSSGSAAATTPKSGGSLTVLEGSSFAGAWPGLDPATDTDGAANQSYMFAIFGELFEVGQGGKVIPDLATGYSFADGGKSVVITLRQGVKFSDGTAFNADAVVFNWKRDLNGTCTCKPIFQGTPVITATGPYTVQISFSYVNAPFVNALQDSIFDWIASPAAIQTMSPTQFALKPVGAGPFTVQTDIPSSELVLKKNPGYWQKGLPYLSTLTFKPVANDETAYTDMLAGSGQAYEGMSTPQLERTFANKFTTTAEPSTSPYDIQLNTKIAPFNNVTARQAIYYATDTPLLDKKLFNNTYPVTQSFTAQAGLFYEPKVPGYITYNLAKAKQLVQQAGGINITLDTISSPVAQALDEALQEEWQAAGMKVTLHSFDLTGLIGAFTAGTWQSFLQTAGAWDPGTGVGVGFRFMSTSPFTGVHDPKLDNLILAAAGTTNNAQRQADYDAVSAYIAQQAYGPFLFPIAGYNIADHGVGGPGLTTAIPSVAVLGEVLWQYAYNDNTAK